MLADTAIAEKIRAKHEKELARTRRADARTVTLPPRAPHHHRGGTSGAGGCSGGMTSPRASARTSRPAQAEFRARSRQADARLLDVQQQCEALRRAGGCIGSEAARSKPAKEASPCHTPLPSSEKRKERA